MVAIPQIYKQSFTMRDNDGHTGQTKFHYFVADVTDGTHLVNARARISAIGAALAAVTSASLIGASGLYEVDLPQNSYGSNLPYASVAWHASLRLASSGTVGGVTLWLPASIGVPSPLLAALMADGITWDNTTVGGVGKLFVTALLTADASGGGVCTIAGESLNTYVGGYVQKRRALLRRGSVYTKSAGLDEPSGE